MSIKKNVNADPVQTHLLLENQLCFSLYSASRAVTRLYAPMLKKLKLTYPQYIALMVLWEEDGQIIQSIADHLEIDQATTTPLIQRLEKLGFVSRKRSIDDERRVQVWLTTRGKNVYKHANSISADIACGVGISVKEAMDIINMMNKMKCSIASMQT